MFFKNEKICKAESELITCVKKGGGEGGEGRKFISTR